MIGKIVRNINFFWNKCKQDNINAFAAQSAFFIMLSSIPFLMLFSSFIQYTPVTEGMIIELITRTTPEYLSPFLVTTINEVYTKSFGIVSVAAITAIWSAAKGIQYLVNGLNVVNDINESRNWFVLRFWAIIYTVVFVLLISASLVILVFGKSIHGIISRELPIVGDIMDLILQLRGVGMLAILVLIFDVIFTMLPNRKVHFCSQLPGAVMCALAWCGVSLGLSIYVDYFNGFSMYGSMTTIVLIMLWMYFCMYIMMLCAEFNVVFDEHIAKVQRKIQEKRKKE